jgi:hypothetical protein
MSLPKKILIDDVKFYYYPLNPQIILGDYSKLPIEIFLDQFVLFNKNKPHNAFFICVANKDCDKFEIFQINLYDDDDYKLLNGELSGKEYLDFLKSQFTDNYHIYIKKNYDDN